MDYTDKARIKDAAGGTSTSKDTLLDRLATAASRAVDRYCAGRLPPESDNYFEQTTVVDEVIAGLVDAQGRILCHPHKPAIGSVFSLSYRVSPRESWISVESADIEVESPSVLAWLDARPAERVKVKITYIGGLATSLTNLPADFVEQVTGIAVRLLKEDQAGLSDAIGVDELGTLVYTKAMPSRVRQMLQPYVRVVPW